MRAVPVRIPREWSDSWFRQFYVEVLAREVLSVSQADIDSAVATHNASPTAHGGLVTSTRTGVDEAYTYFMAG
jgi:hypothetical protein